jgi:SNF2 family DNA or RNA helicase
VRFLALVRWALLCDEMGTGKTIQTIWTMRTLKEEHGEEVFPAIVAAPNNMKGTWRREFAQWWPGVRVEILEGGRVEKLKQIARVKSGKADVLVANWEALRHHSRLAPYGSTRLKRCIECDASLRGDPEVEKKHPQRLCEHCPRELNEIEWRTVVADEAHRAKDPKAKQTRGQDNPALGTDGNADRQCA